jgi:hypothetical protein
LTQPTHHLSVESPWYKSRLFWLVVGLVAGAATVAVIGALVTGSDDEAENAIPAATTDPIEVTDAELATMAEEVGHPIYWIGEQDGATLEASRPVEDRVYVRYLDDGEIGDPRPQFLTVGTYVVEDAIEIQQAVAERDDVRSEALDDGGLAIQSDASPNSVYIAYPDQDLQIEVYDRSPRRAFQTAISDALRPVG